MKSSHVPRMLKYLGCSAAETVSFYASDTGPTTKDYAAFIVGDLRLKTDLTDPYLYMITDYTGYQFAGGVLSGTATWTEIYPQELDPELFQTDTGDAIATDTGVLKVYGKTSNFRTRGTDNKITIELEDNIVIPTSLTVGGLTEGFIRSDSNGLLSTLVDGVAGQTLIGSDVGVPIWNLITPGDTSFTITPGDNTLDLTCVVPTIFGQIDTDAGSALPAAITGIIKVIGDTHIDTSAATNIIFGSLLDDIDLVGFLKADGLVAGTGLTVGNDLTVPDVNPHGVEGTVYVTPGGEFSTMTGDNGEILVGSTVGTAQWSLITSSDGSVVRTVGPNAIDLKIVAPGSFTSIETDGGTAVSAASQIFVVGEAFQTNTTAAGDTLSLNLEGDVVIDNSLTVSSLQGTLYADSGLWSASQGINLQLLNGVNTAIPDWLDPVSEDGTMTIAYGSLAGTLNFQSSFIGPIIPPDLLTLSGDVGTATPNVGVIKIKGGDNISTSGAGKIITVNLKKSIDQPTTNYDYTEGMYFLGDVPFLNNWAWDYTLTAGSKGAFIGEWAGSYGLGVTPSGTIGSPNPNKLPTGNIGLGAYSLSYYTLYRPPRPPYSPATYIYVLYQGEYNSAMGYAAQKGVTDEAADYRSYSLSIGYYNKVYESSIGIGSGAGGIPNSIGMGNQKASSVPIPISRQQTNCYIAGIHDGGLLDTTLMQPVIVDQYAKLGFYYEYEDAITDGKLMIGYYVSTGVHGMRKGGRGAFWPEFGEVTSSDNTIEITKGPGTLDIEQNKSCFSAYQSATVSNVTGDGTRYRLGSLQAFVKNFDHNNDFYVGDGAGTRAYFTAPYDGQYYFTMSVVLTNVVVDAEIIHFNIYMKNHDSSTFPYSMTPSIVNAVASFTGGVQNIYSSGPKLLKAGDRVSLSVLIELDGYGKTVGVQGPDTQWSGFLIQRM